MGRVLVTRHLPIGGLDPLTKAGHEVVLSEQDIAYRPDELEELARGVDGIISHLTDKITPEILKASKRLRVVANAAVGYDNIDVKCAKELGIAVCNTPGVLDQTTADLAFLLILSATRLASDAERDLRAGRWGGWSFMDHLSLDVHGQILGLVGFGRIGREVARRGEGFGMEVVHYGRKNTGCPGYLSSLDELLETSDIVSLHVPLTKDTRHLISKRELEIMKKTAVLVNTARGPVIDEEALADALEDGEIFAAGLDVFDGEPAINPRLLKAPHTVLLPHIGSATQQTRTQMARLAASGVAQVLSGRTPANLV